MRVEHVNSALEQLIQIVFHHGFGHERDGSERQRADSAPSHRQHVIEAVVRGDAAKKVGIADQAAEPVNREDNVSRGADERRVVTNAEHHLGKRLFRKPR